MDVGRLTQVTFAKQQFDRKDIKTALGVRGFYPPFWGCTVSTLSNISLKQFTGMMELLDHVHAYIVNDLQYNEPVALKLPWLANLRAVKLEKVVQSPNAMKQIFERCVKFESGVKADLSILPWIFQKYAV